MPIEPSLFGNANLNTIVTQTVANMLQNPLYGATVLHYRAQLAAPQNFDDRGRPDYLAADPGIYSTGVVYVPNPDNPLRGAFCQSQRRPQQDVGGIFYTGQFELYLGTNPGEVFVLDDKYPKRQDAFDILGHRYYAASPAMPCSSGDTIAAWKIELAVERYPVNN